LSLLIAAGHYYSFSVYSDSGDEGGASGKVSLAYLQPVTMFFILSGVLFAYLYYDKFIDIKLLPFGRCVCNSIGCIAAITVRVVMIVILNQHGSTTGPHWHCKS